MFLDFGGVWWKKSAPAHASAAAGQNFLFLKGQIVKHPSTKSFLIASSVGHFQHQILLIMTTRSCIAKMICREKHVGSPSKDKHTTSHNMRCWDSQY